MKHRNTNTTGLIVSLSLLAAGLVMAAPYGPDGAVTEYQQPKGKKLTLRVLGDEYHARTETLDGYTVVFNQGDQSYYYARPSADGQSLVSTGVKADGPAPRGLLKHQAISLEAVREIAQKRRAIFDSERAQQWRQRVKAVREVRDRKAGLRPAPVAGDEAAAAQIQQAQIQAAAVDGAKVGLTILVQFPDDANTAGVDPTNFPTDRAKIDRYCNGVNYTEDGNTGSVRDYFFDQSSGALTYTQSVTQIVTLPNARNYYNYSDYPANATLRDNGQAGRLIIQHAIDALRAANFDFSNLSVDGTNKVLATNVLFAGNSSGVWAQGLWPHAWSMSGSGINVGTVASPRYIYRYQITNTANAAPVIGTFCHENGHLLLGYPDLYDYQSDSAGAGSHCLMGGGNHLNGGRTPAPINLAFKDYVGWANIVDLTADQGVTASLPTTGNVGRRIRKPGLNTEYFVVENRGTGDRWAANVPDRGICIWHLDDNKDGNDEQQMTSAQHYQVSLEQADGLFDLENDRDGGDAQDLFDSGDPDFNNNTAPNANWWDGTASNIKIRVLSAAGANMDVQFGDVIPANTVLVLAPNGGETFYQGSNVTISWNANIAGNVKIDLLKGGMLHSTLAANETNDGSYAWTVGAGVPVGSDYAIRVSSVNSPAVLDASNAVFEIKSLPTLADALDTPSLVWSTGGTANWFPQSATSHDGSDAAQSGDITHNQNSYVQTTVTGPGTLSFWWKVSSEPNYDFLTLYVDGVEQTGSLAKISGLVDWTQKSVAIPAGSHTVKWEYKKDYSEDHNADTAWLDQVVMTTAAPAEIVVEYPVGTSLTDGTASVACGSATIGTATPSRTITIKNTGGSSLTGLSVSKDGAHAADFAVGALGATTLASGASTSFTVTFTPAAAGARNAAIHVASNDADENPFDIAVTGTGDQPTHPPVFTSNPISRPAATEDSAYAGSTLAGSATDEDAGDTLTYSKVSGPAWLAVAANGTLSGTPSNADVGNNAFAVKVTDNTGLSATATLNISVTNVNDAPTFTSNPISKPGATAGTAYSSSIAGDASDVDAGDTRTFSKVSGPAWLSVAANGALGGTPASGDAGANSFSVRVTDAGGLSANATLNISVTGTQPPAGWTSGDIGSVGVPGSVSESGGVYTVNGSGDDIYGTADSFQFVSRTLVGNGEIRARVTSQTNTEPYAMAGVMIRDGTSPSAINAMMNITPGHGFTFQARSTVSGSTSYAEVGALNPMPNNWVRLVRSGSLISAYVSANGTTWGSPVRTVNLTMGSSVSVGLVVCSRNNSVLGSATFDNVAITPFPAPWVTADVGSPGLAGSAEYFGNAYTLKGAGTLGGTTDGFRYAYQTLSGDGSIVARVSTLQNTGTGARVGIMMRDTLANNSRMAALTMNGSGVWQWQRRTSTGGSVSTTTSSSGTAPNLWVRLTRSGNTITASRSTNGTTWTTISSVSVPMASNCYIGLSVASGSAATLNTSVMDNVTVVP